jgi:hypothetical protein
MQILGPLTKPEQVAPNELSYVVSPPRNFAMPSHHGQSHTDYYTNTLWY